MSAAAPLVHAPARGITVADAKRLAKARKLLPTRDELRARYPDRYREETNPATGKREWVVDVPLRNRDGTRTKAGHDLQDMVAPFIRADRSLPAGPPGQRMRDASGAEQEVQPHLVPYSHGMGWREATTRRFTVIERGPDGMLFRLHRNRWEPLGVRCLGTPLRGSARIPCRGVQRDPDGGLWRGLGRLGWIAVGDAA